jgi:hypothetical protein
MMKPIAAGLTLNSRANAPCDTVLALARMARTSSSVSLALPF